MRISINFSKKKMKTINLTACCLNFVCNFAFAQVVIDYPSEIDYNQMPQDKPIVKSAFRTSEFRILNQGKENLFSFYKDGERVAEIVLSANMQAYSLLWDDHGKPWFILCHVIHSSKEVMALVTVTKGEKTEGFQFFTPTVISSGHAGYVNNLLLIREKNMKIVSIFFDPIADKMRFKIGSIKIGNLIEITEKTRDDIQRLN